MAENQDWDKRKFFDQRYFSFNSTHSQTSKLKMQWFPNEDRYWAGKF